MFRPVEGGFVNVGLSEMRMLTKISDVTEPSELLTKKELARRLRVSERKIELDADLPRIRWGRTVRFDWSEVMSFLKNQRA